MAMTYVSLGNPKGDLLVFLGGFPDDALSGWGPLLEILKPKYKIISLCIPQFENNSKTKKWGYSFDELISEMDKTLVSVIGNQPFTLITHDWGAFLGYKYENVYGSKVKKMISMDIGLLRPEDGRIYQMLVITIYQVWFAVAYAFSQIFGVFIGNLIFRSFFIFGVIFPFLTPCPKDKPPRKLSEVNVEMCYLYFQLWKAVLTGKSAAISPRFPKCPLFFMYATQKNIMFHSKKFLDKLTATPQCKSKSYDCGHWIMLVYAKECADDIEKFIAEK